MNEKFLAAVAGFTANLDKPRSWEQQLLARRDELSAAIGKNRFLSGLPDSNALAAMNRQLGDSIETMLAAWAAGWEAGAPTRRIAEMFGDKVVLLVFGKVNAGKSSFCNFFVEGNAQLAPRHFGIEDGEQVPCAPLFKEGATETTDRLQGVELGGRLVLLDTPGLHSVTEANGALTRRLVDGADAVLWLTSSSSPGQVQELQDLVEEMKKKKPLQPIINKSDTFVTDYDEATGRETRELRPKTPANRALQEQDVIKRVREKFGEDALDASRLRAAISISTRYYKERQGAPGVVAEAGLDRLFDALASIVAEAAGYKAGKANQMVLNYIDASVKGALKAKLVPDLEKLRAAAGQQLGELDAARGAIATAVLNRLHALLPEMIHEYKERRDSAGLARRINEEARQQIADAARTELASYLSQVGEVMFDLAPEEVGSYADLTIDVQQKRGSLWSAGGGLAGAAGGAELGLMLGGPWGAAVGGLVGGILGKFGGEQLVSTTTIQQTIGTGTEAVQRSAAEALARQVPLAVGQVIEACQLGIEPVLGYASQMLDDIARFEEQIDIIREQIHAKSV